MQRRAASVILVLALAMAACTHAPATKPADGAPTPKVDALTGAVAGTVADEELVPIPNATVQILGGNATTTDTAGRFAISNLAPGPYQVHVAALGHEGKGKAFEVVAERVVELSFVLRAVQIGPEPYILMLNRVSHLKFDQVWLTYYYTAVGNHSNICGTCIHTLYFPPQPRQVRTENEWADSGNPVVNARVDLRFDISGNGTSVTRNRNDYDNRAHQDFEQTYLDALKKVDRMKLTVYSSITTVSIEHRISTWVSLAYHGPMDPEFSALAPKA